MVVAFHAGLPVPGGFVGVDIFFVISGFVITSMLMREWSSTGRIRLARFYVRRFRRLTPALALTVGVVMVASLLLLSPLGNQETVASTGLGAMLLAANVVIAKTTGDYFDAPAENNPLLNTWSLSVEEQFYLVFPAVLMLGWWMAKRKRPHQLIPMALVGTVGALSFALALAGSVGLKHSLVPEVLVGFYGPATRAWEFALGALLALGGTRLALSSARLALPLVVAGAAMLTASMWLITDTTPFPGVWTLLPVTGALLLIAAAPSNSVAARALASSPMVAVGDRSYSIYLWHWPFIVFARLLWPESSVVVLAAALLSFIPAYASYRWVEQPIRALPGTGGAVSARLVAATLIPPLVLAGALGLAARNGFWNATVLSYQQAIQPFHAGMVAGCVKEAWRSQPECTWNGQASGQPIYLVGDSNADHFSEALIGAAEMLSRPLVGLAEDGGCAYLPSSLSTGEEAKDARCRPYTDNAEDYLLDAEPGLVVVSNGYGWFTNSSIAVGATGERPSRDPRVKLDALSAGLSTGVRTLQQAGHTVLLVQAVPHWKDQNPLGWETCSVPDMVTVGCARSMPLEDAVDRQGPAADVVAAVARTTGARVLDVSSELCPDGTCSSVAADGLIQYRDGSHITVQQSEALTEVFYAAMVGAP